MAATRREESNEEFPYQRLHLFNDGKETATPLLDFIKNVVKQWGSSRKSTNTNDEWEDKEDDDQPKPKLKRRHAYTWQRDVTQHLTGSHND